MTGRLVVVAILLINPFATAIIFGVLTWRGEMGRVIPTIATAMLGMTGGAVISRALLSFWGMDAP